MQIDISTPIFMSVYFSDSTGIFLDSGCPEKVILFEKSPTSYHKVDRQTSLLASRSNTRLFPGIADLAIDFALSKCTGCPKILCHFVWLLWMSFRYNHPGFFTVA